MGLKVDDAHTAEVRTVLRIARALRDAAGIFHPPCHPLTSKNPHITIDSLNLPSPHSLLPSLFEAGFSHETAAPINEAYQLRAEELRRRIQQSIATTCREMAELPAVALALSLDVLTTKLVNTFTELYLRRLAGWKEEIIQRIKQAQKAPSKVALRNGRIFNQEYVPLLERFFKETPFPTHADKLFLAEKSNMEYKQIHVWFQNRRSRTKKESKTLRRKPVNEGTARSLEMLHKYMDDHMADSDSWVPRSFKNDSERGTTKTAITQNKVSEDNFVSSSPFHAFPSPYPPICPYDPFPCKSGPAKFSRPEWRRTGCSKSPHPFSTSIYELVEKFSQLNVRDETHSRRSPKLQAHAATAAFTIVPSRAPHPALMVSTYHQAADIVKRHPIVRAPFVDPRIFRSPSSASEPFTPVSPPIPLETNEFVREPKTTPLPRHFPYRTRNAHRDTAPSENLTSSSSRRLCSPESDCRSCSSSINSLSTPSDITSDQEL